MDIHEYQAKLILQKYLLPVPDFGVASNEEEAREVVKHLKLKEAIVKVQIHAGGRGRAGGVIFAKSPKEILSATEKLIGKRIINRQTGPSGLVCHQVLISKPVEIQKEFYIAALIDRESSQGMLILSCEGGMEIEELAKTSPEKILKVPLPLNRSLYSYEIIPILKFMGWYGPLASKGHAFLQSFVKAFVATDALLLEINPLGLSKEGEFQILDAKVTVDDNALYRQKEVANCYDPTQLTTYEVLAKDQNLSYVALDGTIGCMVNGAGLAMATLDIIKHFGGQPANFLDVGGGATFESIAEGFKIICMDPKVRVILVNIFGGIMNCATIADGIIKAIQELKSNRDKNKPLPALVVRMEGTNVEKGKSLLIESKNQIILADDLEDAARKSIIASGII